MRPSPQAPQIAVPWVGLIRPFARLRRAPGPSAICRPPPAWHRVVKPQEGHCEGCAFIPERKVAGLGHTDVQRGIRRWPKAHRSELNSGAQGCLAGHPPALASRPFVRAALPSSRAARPRAPGAALLGSSCAGNPSSWAWVAILSSCHALASLTPMSRRLETSGAPADQLALAGNCAATPKRHSPAILLQSSFARNQATGSGRARAPARCHPPSVRQRATMTVPCCPVQLHKAAGHRPTRYRACIGDRL